MDTRKTPPEAKLPHELLDAAREITRIGSDIFVFGGFPKVDIRQALIEARRRWVHACKFDLALRMWAPTLAPTPRHLAKALYGAADPQAAESTWFDAVFLWPDQDSQESAASRIWALDEDGNANEEAHNARIDIAKSQGELRAANKKHRWKEAGRIKAALDDPAVRVRAREDLHHLHPELWIRYVVLHAHNIRKLNSKGTWRQDARDELVKIIPKASGLEYDALGTCCVFAASYRWIKSHRKISPNCEMLRDVAGMSVSEAACEVTVRLFRAIKYLNAPSSRTIRRIIKSSKYIQTMKTINHS